MAERGLCSIPNCGKRALARGWCSQHYQRWDKNGGPLKLRRPSYDAQCSIPNCGKSQDTRGLCKSHYRRLQRYGDPLAGSTAKGELAKYFHEVVLTYDGNECLIWPYTKTASGYGEMRGSGRSRFVSRLVCEEIYGPPPAPKYEAAHLCGKGHLGCVAKKHLAWKTPKGNTADKLLHGTHNRGERCGTAKLTEPDVLAIRALDGEILRVHLAQRFGVTEATIRDIQRRKRWAWLA